MSAAGGLVLSGFVVVVVGLPLCGVWLVALRQWWCVLAVELWLGLGVFVG